jgi:hypothetical protein
METAIETLRSIPFAVAVTALIRKRWQQVDGAYVAVVVFVFAVLGAVLLHYRAFIPGEIWVALGPVLATILGMGTVQTLSHVASKVPSPAAPPVFGGDEPPTVKDTPTVPPKSPL